MKIKDIYMIYRKILKEEMQDSMHFESFNTSMIAWLWIYNRQKFEKKKTIQRWVKKQNKGLFCNFKNFIFLKCVCSLINQNFILNESIF